MSKSIMQNEKVCFITGTPPYGNNLHKHHIFRGEKQRDLSEKYGLWVYLRADWHEFGAYGIHNDRELFESLQKAGQARFEEVYPELDFEKIFGRNYL